MDGEGHCGQQKKLSIGKDREIMRDMREEEREGERKQRKERKVQKEEKPLQGKTMD